MVYDKFDGDKRLPRMEVEALAALLGYRSVSDLKQNQTEEDNHTMTLLAGPNGYTVYKMLLARKVKD